MLEDHTGLHPLDQKLTYRNMERDSKAYLDVARVKDGSKIVLVEDIASKERRCLEMLKNAKMEKSSKSLSQISLEVDKFAEQVNFSLKHQNGFLPLLLLSLIFLDILVEMLLMNCVVSLQLVRLKPWRQQFLEEAKFS